MRVLPGGRRGQVIVMVTLVLFAMCGIMGLAVDLGWAYFVKKSAQAAADSAALAAASKAFDTVGEGGSYSTLDTPGTPVPCSSGGLGLVLLEGCAYAQRNGFSDSGRQGVSMAAGAYSVPVAAPKVGSVHYWVTARVSERIPQLFSAVLGNVLGGASARATAVVINVEAPGSLYTLDRQFDYGNPDGGTGNDIFVAGNSKITAGGDVYLASTSHGESDHYAGEGRGSGGGVEATNGGVFIRGAGWVEPGTEGRYVPTLENGQRDGSIFKDPFRGKGQPPPPPANGPRCAVPLGDLNTYCASGTCGPGNYFAVDKSGQATGDPLVLSADVRFGAGGSCDAGSSNPGGFGEYVFFGGFEFAKTTSTFEPGRYVLAGARQGSPPTLWSIDTQTNLQDNTPLQGGQSVPNTDAGEIFIFTDTNYPRLWIPPEVQSLASQLKFGVSDLQAGGAGGKTEINLHGLNPDHPAVPADLKTFSPTVFWQDQRNSTIKYTPGGYIDCGQVPETSPGCAAGYSIDNPKTTGITNGSPEMNLQATPSTHLYGVVYQPRGAWVVFQGSGTMIAPMQVITGSISLHGGPEVILQPLGNPIRRQVVALVE
jgi:hypothetical protein